MPQLALHVLGAPRIQLDGQDVELERHKSLALLVFLAVAGGRHRRDSLAALLWPELDQARARAGVRAALWALNSTLRGDWWDIQREAIGLLSGADVWLDLAEFRQLLAACRSHGHTGQAACSECLGPLTRAADLYRGDFLAGFGLRDAPAFDDWQLAQAEAIRRELAGAVERLVHLHLGQEQFELAVAYGHRWLALDPLHEPAHQSLMRLYAWSDQRSAALRQYAECARVLEAELGVAPQEATRQLYQAIKENRLPPPQAGTPVPSSALSGAGGSPAAVPSPRTPVSPQPAPKAPTGEPSSLLDRIRQARLVGREAELEVAARLWSRAQSGEGQVLLVSGEPGIGKSRLVRELRSAAQAAGARVLIGECHAEGGPPYGALAQMIGAALGDPAGGPALPDYVVADLLLLAPHLRPRFGPVAPNPALDPGFERQRLFDSFVTWCGWLAAQAPLLLIVEDAHWADSGTLFVLRHLARQIGDSRLLLVVTHRDTQADLAAADRLDEVILDLNRERLAQTLRLGRLGRDQTGQLLAALLATGEVSEPFTNSVFNETEGNPYFVEEVCKALVDHGQLYLAGDTWRRRDLKTVVLPRSIQAAILARCERLSAAAREALRVAAVLGREFEFGLLRAAAGQDEATLIAGLEEAERGQLLEAQRPGPAGGPLRFRFAHALVPFSLRASLSALRLQRLHRQVAAALEAERPDDVNALAFHFTAGGESHKSIEYLIRAAERATAVFAYDSAVQYLQSALNLSVRGVPRLGLLEQLADVHQLRGAWAEAVRGYQEALEVWATLDAGDEASRIRLLRKLSETVWGTEWQLEVQPFQATALAALEEGLQRMAGRPAHPDTVRLLIARSHSAWRMRQAQDWDAAERDARQAVAMAEQLDAPLELSRALDALAVVHAARGQFRERVDISQRRLAAVGNPGVAGSHEHVRALIEAGAALSDVGEYQRALPYLEQAERLATRVNALNDVAYALHTRSLCLFRLDRWDEVLMEAKLAALRERDPQARLIPSCFHMALMACVHSLRGEGTAAASLRQQSYAYMLRVEPTEAWGRGPHY